MITIFILIAVLSVIVDLCIARNIGQSKLKALQLRYDAIKGELQSMTDLAIKLSNEKRSSRFESETLHTY